MLPRRSARLAGHSPSLAYGLAPTPNNKMESYLGVGPTSAHVVAPSVDSESKSEHQSRPSSDAGSVSRNDALARPGAESESSSGDEPGTSSGSDYGSAFRLMFPSSSDISHARESRSDSGSDLDSVMALSFHSDLDPNFESGLESTHPLNDRSKKLLWLAMAVTFMVSFILIKLSARSTVANTLLVPRNLSLDLFPVYVNATLHSIIALSRLNVPVFTFIPLTLPATVTSTASLQPSQMDFKTIFHRYREFQSDVWWHTRLDDDCSWVDKRQAADTASRYLRLSNLTYDSLSRQMQDIHKAHYEAIKYPSLRGLDYFFDTVWNMGSVLGEISVYSYEKPAKDFLEALEELKSVEDTIVLPHLLQLKPTHDLHSDDIALWTSQIQFLQYATADIRQSLGSFLDTLSHAKLLLRKVRMQLSFIRSHCATIENDKAGKYKTQWYTWLKWIRWNEEEKRQDYGFIHCIMATMEDPFYELFEFEYKVLAVGEWQESFLKAYDEAVGDLKQKSGDHQTVEKQKRQREYEAMGWGERFRIWIYKMRNS